MRRRQFVINLVSDLAAVTGGVAEMSGISPLIAEERAYLTEQQAKLVFPHSNQIVPEDHDLTADQERSIAVALRYRLASRRQRVWRGSTGDVTDEYAMILNEIGKEQYITFIVGITPDFRVERVALMVFGESRGGEVRDARFTNQFRGKRSSDRLVVGADIIGITGATLSSQALCRGAKKALVICEALYRK
jgi:Na+-translocating ferredoxin:NAD+ oxidoreductase RnfG subunit